MYAPANLRAAFTKVKANGGAAGVDHQTIAMYEQHLEENLNISRGRCRKEAIDRRRSGGCGYQAGEQRETPAGYPDGSRPGGAERAAHVLEPIFERDFAEQSYGFRPGRGCKDALRRVDELLKAGYTWVVDADLKSYFDTIPAGRC